MRVKQQHISTEFTALLCQQNKIFGWGPKNVTIVVLLNNCNGCMSAVCPAAARDQWRLTLAQVKYFLSTVQIFLMSVSSAYVWVMSRAAAAGPGDVWTLYEYRWMTAARVTSGHTAPTSCIQGKSKINLSHYKTCLYSILYDVIITSSPSHKYWH